MQTAQIPPTVDEPEFGYGQLLGILVRRFVWLSGGILGGLGAAVFLTLKAEPVYRSSMQLLIEPNYRQTVDITGEEDNLSSRSQADYATQLNLMRSTTFIEQAVERLQESYPELCSETEELAECVSGLQSALTLSQVIEDDTETRIFEATFKAADPALAQSFLEALGAVYLSYNEDQQDRRLEEGLTLVNQQISEVGDSLADSRQALKQFRQTENLIDPEQQSLTVADSLMELNQDRIEVSNQYLEAQAQYSALQNQLNADPQAALISSRLSQSSRYQELLNTLQETELALQERLALYAEADPGVQDLRSQRQRQLLLLQEEVKRVLGEVPGQISLDESALLTEGQMSEIDLGLVAELVNAQVRLQGLEAQQAGLDEAVQQLQANFSKFPTLIEEYDSIQPEIEIQQQSLEQLLQIRQELSNELAQGGFSWDIVEAPQPGNKIAPQPKQNLLLGLVAGAFVGGALAFGREAIDNVVRTSDELKKQAPLPLLGVIPEIPAVKSGTLLTILDAEHAPADSFSLSQWEPFRDAVDLIYKTIQLTSSQPLSSLMVTSALVEEGKTTLSIGLAMSAARSHQRVLLIDANLRHPSLHQRLSLPNEEGLSTQLQPNQANQLRISPISLPFSDTSIDVLLAGAVPEDPLRLLSSLQMRQLIEKAETKYDLVIVDAPVISGLADGLQLASMCQASLLVSRLDRITQADLTQAMTVLSQVNTIGIVANRHRANLRPNKPYERNGSAKISAGEPEIVWKT
ncbi:MAG: capsular biosynthesis protein [Leptolyngbya sp. SIO4C1]|nr:capsular biosynthesis protein [Leptolyngbya sp. SIO4C1]